MKRQYILPIVVLVVFMGVIGGTYQFFFKERLAQFQLHNEYLVKLKDKHQKLQTTFMGADGRPVKPQVIIERKQSALDPWQEAISQRASYYKIPLDITPVPPDKTPRFFYRDEWPKQITTLQRYLMERNLPLINVTFDTPDPKTLEGKDVTKQNVESWMVRFAFGKSLLELLVGTGGATEIRALYVWPAIKESDLLKKQVVGVQMTMPMSKFIDFMDEMYMKDRYFNVEAFRLSNRTLRTTYDPPVTVDLLFTQAAYIDNTAAVVAAAAGTGKTPAAAGAVQKGVLKLKSGAGAAGGTTEAAPKPKSWWESLWPF
jgi:hypothetical protein